ncbi:fungal-specific transcription factor domain-containing protein [Aspergillus granulosus]|uniref:Fungal-specific transcription factor domain-containing protein n=1 Tax=Aspergillus granulosus TaxID=176169 RepID=A0ABR4HXV4_9EURO
MSSQDLKAISYCTRSRRAARACARCHSRKVRCDGSITGFPCTNCRLDGRSCTLHSGKRDKEKQVLRAMSRDRERMYPAPPGTNKIHPDSARVTFVRSQGALRVPIQEVLDIFTKHYFLYVHPCLPVVDEALFWRKYRSVDGSAGKISTLLFQAMLFATSSFVPLEAAKECGYDSLQCARDDLYRRAKRLYELGVEKDRFVVAQAALLLTYYSTDAERSNNSRWLRTAIRHAKKERAHLYHHLQPSQKTLDLKRLWWCCMIRDRIISLGMRRPLQITPDEFDLNQPGLSFEDLQEECLQSEVYNPETKVALCRVLASLCHLAVAVTGSILLVYPTTHSMPYSLAERRALLDQLEETKFALLEWEFRWVANPDGKEYYIHPSLTLYTNLCAIYYQSARIALCNRICFLIGHNTYLSDETDLPRLESCRTELAMAIRSTADNVKQLILYGVADKLPISAVAYTLFPQILLSIQTQLSTTEEDKQLHEVMLVFFVEVFRCFRSQYYMSLIFAVSWQALELCHAPNRSALPSANNNTGCPSTSLVPSNAPSNTQLTKSPGYNPTNAINYLPILFQLRLTEYLRLLRYVDEFFSLRAAPGEGFVYPPPSVRAPLPPDPISQSSFPSMARPKHRALAPAPAVVSATSPSETVSSSWESEPASKREDADEGSVYAGSMEDFFWVYFGEAELDFAGREDEVKTDTPSASSSDTGYGVDGEGGEDADCGREGIGEGIDQKEVAGFGIGPRVEDNSFQNMLDCLPLLGE